MYGIKVELVAETASFRDPGGQLYHVCLPLPPVSTIIGIAGAALGLSFEQVWNWFRDQRISVGVQGEAVGRGKDLWNYTKRTVNLEKENNSRSDIVNREFLCFVERKLSNNSGVLTSTASPVKLYYACEHKEAVQKLYQAFREPVYALTLGTNDELAKCVSLTLYEAMEPVETDELCNVMVEGDWSRQFSFDWETIRAMPVTVSLTSPTVTKLPVDYSFESNGVRKGLRYQSFTFLTSVQRLKVPVRAYQFDQDRIPLISIYMESKHEI
jgi:CRISPR-associated protein Cas5t